MPSEVVLALIVAFVVLAIIAMAKFDIVDLTAAFGDIRTRIRGRRSGQGIESATAATVIDGPVRNSGVYTEAGDGGDHTALTRIRRKVVDSEIHTRGPGKGD